MQQLRTVHVRQPAALVAASRLLAVAGEYAAVWRLSSKVIHDLSGVRAMFALVLSPYHIAPWSEAEAQHVLNIVDVL